MTCMARPSKFSEDQILDAAAGCVRELGSSATLTQVARALGAPSGSIYHRFGSREELFVALWLRSIRRFHERYLLALAEPDPMRAAVDAALSIPRFCREYPDDAAAMTLYRQDELARTAPESLREEVAHVNDQVIDALTRLTHLLFGDSDPRSVELLAIACQESPYALVRRHLGGSRVVPDWLDDVVRVSSSAILGLGPGTGDDRPSCARG